MTSMTKPVALLFGYGSLLSPRSINRTLPGFLDRGQRLIPLIAHNWRRTWNAVMPNTSRLNDGNGFTPRGIAFMNVEPEEGAKALGIVFPVYENDVKALDVREHLYHRAEVTDFKWLADVSADKDLVRLPIITYSADEPWTHESPLKTVGIREDYRHLIRNAGKVLDQQYQLGTCFEEDFEEVNRLHPHFLEVLPPDDSRYEG
jgi:hypothetical protein